MEYLFYLMESSYKSTYYAMMTEESMYPAQKWAVDLYGVPFVKVGITQMNLIDASDVYNCYI